MLDDDLTAEDDETTTQEEKEQMEKMISWIVSVLLNNENWSSRNVTDEVQIEAKLENISNVGEVTIKFEPPVVMVPNDWNRLWSQEEKDKLSLRDREIYEEELKKLMHVEFL